MKLHRPLSVDIRSAMPRVISVDCTVRVKGVWRARAARLLLRAAGRLLATEFRLSIKRDG